MTADVSLGPDTAGGFAITGIALTVRGEVEGLDAAGFEKAAQAAKDGCPVSKALTGTDDHAGRRAGLTRRPVERSPGDEAGTEQALRSSSRPRPPLWLSVRATPPSYGYDQQATGNE